MEKLIKVNSISEYLNVIDLHKLSNCYSRGENQDYGETKLYSSSFRDFNPEWTDIVDAFQFEVTNQLTDLQNKYFLAFAQHHQVKTNLLDFSSSPLVSLYFASKLEKSSADDNSGFVYFILKSKCIDSNILIDSYKTGKSFSEKVSDWDVDFINNLAALLQPVMYGNAKDSLESFLKMFLFLNDYFRLKKSDKNDVKQFGNLLNEFECLIKEDINNGDKFINLEDYRHVIYEMVEDIIELFRDDPMVNRFAIIFDNLKLAKTSIEYLYGIIYTYLIIISLCYYVQLFFDPEYFTKDFILPFYFIHNVPFIDERVKNQNSLFIYQLWNNFSSFQIIKPDFIIEICNKMKIQEQLNNLGINEKFIFCDFDHIGKHYSSVYKPNSYLG